MRITSKGQVTIPQEIRERLGLMPLTEVEFEIDGDHAVIRKAHYEPGTSPRARAAIAALWGSGDRGMTTDEIMMLTRGRRMPGKKKRR